MSELINTDSSVTGVEVKDVVPSNERTELLAQYPEFAGPNQPAVFVTWPEAKAYCEAQGKRLPTGEEWERAARGPQGYEYGTHSGTLNHQEAQYCSVSEAVHATNESDVVHAAVDVKSFQPNGYGVYDMTGNVWEWTLEDYQEHGTKGFRGGSWYIIFPATSPRPTAATASPRVATAVSGFVALGRPPGLKSNPLFS
ncbi:MAG: SUMF1/EgtB/PvdO family nonheme iron enzyme [Deltaproteobacteria bacterium]|nr:SUMF1/EgtB/PvdO family nonheme iron enzyme [Deltaproteobacteria bacterium]